MRTKPAFGKKDDPYEQIKNNDPIACIRIPFVIVVSYVVLSAIVRVTSGGGSVFDQFLCYGSLLGVVIIAILGFRENERDKAAAEKEKQAWKNSCNCVKAAIVERHGYSGGSYEDEYGIPHTTRPHYRLTLSLPDQRTVTADVSQAVYEKLENRDTVSIYYQPETPLTFLLEEEIE